MVIPPVQILILVELMQMCTEAVLEVYVVAQHAKLKILHVVFFPLICQLFVVLCNTTGIQIVLRAIHSC